MRLPTPEEPTMTESVLGCDSFVCRPHYPHGHCVRCQVLTDGKTVQIELGTLRRRRVFMCFRCLMQPQLPEQARLRAERTRRDWELVTDPIDYGLLELDRMPEQYPSRTRAALRAFQESEATVAVVAVNAATLNQSLATLGLGSVMYAEMRGQETVLRKLPALTEP